MKNGIIFVLVWVVGAFTSDHFIGMPQPLLFSLAYFVASLTVFCLLGSVSV